MKQPPVRDFAPTSTHAPSAWKTTSPSQFFADPIPPRRVPPSPRRAPQLAALTSEAHVWLARLPPRYQPLGTARQHPHIINNLTTIWHSPTEAAMYLSELMLCPRPGRQGFNFEVLTELVDLQAMLAGEGF